MKKIVMFVLFAAACIAIQADIKPNLWPLNPAESIINPHVPGGKKYNVKAVTPDTFVKFTYYGTMRAKSSLKDKAQCEIKLNVQNIKCGRFDQMIFVCGGANLNFKLIVDTDKGEKSAESSSNGWYGSCTLVNLDGAGVVKSAKVLLTASTPGRGAWGFTPRFFALRDRAAFDKYIDYYKDRAAVDWDKYIKDGRCSFQPQVFCAPKEFDEFRKYCMSNKDLKSMIESNAAGYKSPSRANPWKIVQHYLEKDYAGFLTNQHMTQIRSCTASAALIAAILKDEALARVAARYALSMANMDNWNDNFQTESTGTKPWKVFRDADASVCLSMALDCIGNIFTAYGYNYVQRNLEQKGVNAVMLSVWGRHYVLKLNQGMVFLRGQMIPMLIFRKNWKHLDDYIAACKRKMDECVSLLFSEDGGYLESTGYLEYTAASSIECYLPYANAMNLPLSKVIPPLVAKITPFGEAVCSTSKNPGRNQIVFGQTVRLHMLPTSSSFMAAAAPGSVWQRFLPKENPYGVYSRNIATILNIWQLRRQAKMTDTPPPLKPFIFIPSNAIASSVREYAGETLKILYAGYSGKGGKRFNDFGFFVIEYAGDVFAESLVSYGPAASGYAIPEWRNVLVPTGIKGIAQQKHYSQFKGKSTNAKASGNQTSFTASNDNLQIVWDPKYFKKWSRKINSPTPEKITITDDYELGSAATGVDFSWITTLPAELKDERIIITGDYGAKCELSWDRDCQAKVERFSPGTAMAKAMCADPKRKFSRILIHREGKKGRIEVSVKLIAPPKK